MLTFSNDRVEFVPGKWRIGFAEKKWALKNWDFPEVLVLIGVIKWDNMGPIFRGIKECKGMQMYGGFEGLPL